MQCILCDNVGQIHNFATKVADNPLRLKEEP